MRTPPPPRQNPGYGPEYLQLIYRLCHFDYNFVFVHCLSFYPGNSWENFHFKNLFYFTSIVLLLPTRNSMELSSNTWYGMGTKMTVAFANIFMAKRNCQKTYSLETLH